MRVGDLLADRFELEQLTNSGGTGAIWRAHDRVHGARVALKILHLHGASARERFAREAAVLAELSHPAIVRYVAHGTARGDVPYIAMEWLSGDDLSERLRRGRMSMAESVALARRLASALAVAHARGVIHRDVKPANVILTDGDPERAKLVDFGVARPRPSDAMAVRVVHTNTGAPIGSPGYMAPEQARGDRVIEASADVFGLGCVIFECLTGRPAFAGEHLMAILAKLVLEDPPRVSELVAQAPAALDDLVARMLDKDPSKRPADGAAVLRELDALGATRANAPAKATSLGRSELRLVSVVMAAGHASSDSAPTLVPDAAPPPTGEQGDPLASFADAHTQVVQLADGTRLVVLTGEGMATDQAARAARAALAIQRRTTAPVALATGRAIVEGRLPVGEAIDRAAKLLALPDTRGIRADRATTGLLDARFEVGRDDASELLLAERARDDATLRALPFVGRDRELGALTDMLEECASEPIARAVVMTGAPGIGKSRLRREWLARVREAHHDLEIWSAQGDPIGASPFTLLGAMLRRASDVALGEDPAAARAKLAALVARSVGEKDRQRVAEFLGEIASVPFPDEASEPLRAARADAQLMADQTLRAWLDFVSAAVRTRPMVIVFEDVHWGDLPSVQWVDAALRRLRDAPLFALAIGRPELDARIGRPWAERGAQTFVLTELGKRTSERLARAVLGAGASDAVVARIVEQGAGNPLLLEELVRAEREGRGRETPETVRAIVHARLETLPEPARRVLRAASVFGTSFWRNGIVALLGGDAASEIDEWLAELVLRELITRRSVSRFANEVEYSFTQPLVGQAAYAMLVERDRTLGHRLAADWLLTAGESNAVALAEHFEAAGAKEQAAAWWRRAAIDALESHDLTAAVTRGERAIAMGLSPSALTEVQLVLIDAHVWGGKLDAAHEHVRKALGTFEPGSKAWFVAIGELGVICERLGDTRGVVEVCERTLAQAPLAGAEIARALAACRLAIALVYMGDHDRGYAMMELAASIAKEQPYDARLEGRIGECLALRAAHEGDYGKVLVHLRAAQAAFSRAGDMRRVMMMLHNQGDALMHLGRYDDAARFLRDAHAQASAFNVEMVQDLAQSNLAFALGRSGKLAEARSLLESPERNDAIRVRAFRRIYTADVKMRMGDLDGAARSLDAALELLASHRSHRAHPLGLRATLALARGDVGGALEAAREGMDIVREYGSVGEGEAFLRLAHVRALDASGDRSAARAARAEARDVHVARAARIDDRELRESFLARVEEHAQTLALAREWNLEPIPA